jgi:hypothetical protein
MGNGQSPSGHVRRHSAGGIPRTPLASCIRSGLAAFAGGGLPFPPGTWPSADIGVRRDKDGVAAVGHCSGCLHVREAAGAQARRCHGSASMASGGEGRRAKGTADTGTGAYWFRTSGGLLLLKTQGRPGGPAVCSQK